MKKIYIALIYADDIQSFLHQKIQVNTVVLKNVMICNVCLFAQNITMNDNLFPINAQKTGGTATTPYSCFPH